MIAYNSPTMSFAEKVEAASKSCTNCKYHGTYNGYMMCCNPCERCYVSHYGPTKWEAKDAGKEGGR